MMISKKNHPALENVFPDKRFLKGSGGALDQSIFPVIFSGLAAHEGGHPGHHP
jgi:hypothetical protein